MPTPQPVVTDALAVISPLARAGIAVMLVRNEIFLSDLLRELLTELHLP